MRKTGAGAAAVTAFFLGSFLGAASASAVPASTAPPECDAGNRTFQAVLCAQTIVPIDGVFATWKNIDFEYTEPYGGMWAQKNVVLETSGTTQLSMGLRSTHGGQFSDEFYGPYWQEYDGENSEYKAINAGAAHTADGVSHTYMALRDGNGPQLDILYDFNVAATTTLQASGNADTIESGLSMFDPPQTTVDRHDTRIQFMSGNDFFRRFNADNTAVDTSAAFCGQSDTWKRPFCFNSSLNNKDNKFVSWKLDKPGPTTLATGEEPSKAPHTGGTPANTGVVNGVDQKELARCMRTAPAQCLTSVEGLTECVQNRDICNVAAHERQQAARTEPAPRSVSAEQARSLAATRYSLNQSDITAVETTVNAYDAAMGTSLHQDLPGGHPLWRLTSPDTVTASNGDTFDGLTAAYDASTGRLLHACLGPDCAP